MRLHIADLKSWSACDRRIGGKAVLIKQGALFGHGASIVLACQPCQLISCCISTVALRRRKAVCQHGPQPARAREAWHSRASLLGGGFRCLLGEGFRCGPPAAVNWLCCPAGRLLRGVREGTPQAGRDLAGRRWARSPSVAPQGRPEQPTRWTAASPEARRGSPSCPLSPAASLAARAACNHHSTNLRAAMLAGQI